MGTEHHPRHKCGRPLVVPALLFALLLALGGCVDVPPASVTVAEAPTGDPAAGLAALEAYGCHACHMIPGASGPPTYVGPPLTAWAERSYIAGTLPNEPEHLEAWIRFPQAIEPGSAMPNLDVTEEDARNMSAYLYTLRSDRTWYGRFRHILQSFD